MNQVDYETKKDYVISKDGTSISYQVMGKGPGLVIVHGSFRASQHYQRLASYLSSSYYTVYLLDRRGRNDSGPQGSEYSIEKECDDVLALLQKHDVSYIFGHSNGGLITLNTVIQHPVKKLAVYEPPVSVNGSFPTGWLPSFEQQLKQKDYASATVSLITGLRMAGTAGILPKPILKIIARSMFFKGPERKLNIDLLHTIPSETRGIGMYMESKYEHYKQISAPILVLRGTKSADYFHTATRVLESVLPNHHSIALRGVDHSAPDDGAPEIIAKNLKEFFVD
jgi:pimeloyl-ACP methyl ester carboxylesterase